jgi:heme-degrading monooxygenase HmoA
MYIAMNRFQIVLGREIEFENIWKNRETHLGDVPGFIQFHLVKGAKEETYTLYASHSTWNSIDSFYNWTKSEAFKQAHKGAGIHSGVYLGHPIFEGFEVII